MTIFALRATVKTRDEPAMIRSFVSPEGKSIKENVARAKGHMRGNRFRKAMDAALCALDVRARAKLYGQERLEADFQLAEFCDEFSDHPKIIAFLREIKYRARPFLRYEKERVDFVRGRLGIMRRRWDEKLEEKERARAERRLAEKEGWLEKADSCFKAGELPKGKVYLRRVAEKYGQEPGVMTDVGRRMLEAELFYEAAELLGQTIELFPAEATAYKFRVEAFMGLGEYPKAEEVYLAAIKKFGAHPRTYLNMCELYKVWRKRDKIFEYAQRALALDPTSPEAKKLLGMGD